MSSSIRAVRSLPIAVLLAVSLMTTGCATTAVSSAPADAVLNSSYEPASGVVPMVRYGRYTLVELVPEPAQGDLLQQVIDISIPSAPQTTVGDALRYVLLRSGYQLCDTTDTTSLYALPLPAAHAHLGPLTVRDALLVLAGPAWQLSVDDRNRQVCFRPQGASAASSIAMRVAAPIPAMPASVPRIESTSGTTVPPVAIGTTTAIPKRPFRVLGVELRGGERWLSVRPKAAGSLATTQFLREGEAFGDWRLLLIDTRTALFDVNGLRVRVALP
jgi:type IV pili sensor histidine kinase/response regulator